MQYGPCACLERAEALAQGPQEWFELAEAIFDLLSDSEWTETTLTRARSNDPASVLGLVDEIAGAYRHWLGQREEANRISMYGAEPASIGTRHRVLAGWQADLGSLFFHLNERMTLPQLRQIAGSDYSDGDKHLAALLDIFETKRVLVPMTWHPLEVLELTRWNDGETTDHVMRAWACVLLCINTISESGGGGVEQTVAVLLESAFHLDGDVATHLLGFLVALAERYPYEDEESLAFLFFALLLTAVRADPRDPRLPSLVDTVVRSEAALCRQGAADRNPEYGWLLCTTRYDQKHALWKQLATEILGSALAQHPELDHVRHVLTLFSSPVRPGEPA